LIRRYSPSRLFILLTRSYLVLEMHSKLQFALNDQNAGVFAEICAKIGLNNCWLQWKYEM
jgi:hypothetical protein